MNRFYQQWLRRPWFSVLLLTAFLSHALVPVGFMPGHGGLILCSGYAPLPTTISAPDSAMDMSGMDMAGMDMSAHTQPAGEPHNSPDHASTGVCPFAAAAVAVAMAQMAPAIPLLEPLSTVTLFPPEQYLPRGTIVPTRLPRGPPSNA